MANATAVLRGKVVGPDVEIQYRQSSRESKWDMLVSQVSEMEIGEKLIFDIPKGHDPALYRNTISNACYMHIRRPGLFPDYRFPVKLSADLKQVVIQCREALTTPRKPRAARAAKKKNKAE